VRRKARRKVTDGRRGRANGTEGRGGRKRNGGGRRRTSGRKGDGRNKVENIQSRSGRKRME